jgi:hypothetical protein
MTGKVEVGSGEKTRSYPDHLTYDFEKWIGRIISLAKSNPLGKPVDAGEGPYTCASCGLKTEGGDHVKVTHDDGRIEEWDLCGECLTALAAYGYAIQWLPDKEPWE